MSCSVWNFDWLCRRLGLSRMDVKRLVFHADATRGLAKLPYLPEGCDVYLFGKEGRLLFVYVRTKKKKKKTVS